MGYQKKLIEIRQYHLDRMKKQPFLPVSVVIPMRNASSTIEETLKSIAKQKYPFQQIIVVDNASTDDSVKKVKTFSKKNKKLKVNLLINKKNIMIARSLRKGINAVKTSYIILMHADCRLVGPHEFEELVEPLITNKNLVATYGQIHQPLSIWEKYAFWEQFLFAHQAGATIPGLVGKIDCLKKQAYIQAGGHDIIGHDNYGGEDADLHARLKKIGPTQETHATIEHLHYMYADFSFFDLLEKKQQTAGAYGTLLRRYGLSIGVLGLITMLIKPLFAIGLLIPQISIFVLMTVVIYIVLYYRRMFLTPAIFFNPKIFFIPLAFIFLVYYETFYTFLAFFRTEQHFARG